MMERSGKMDGESVNDFKNNDDEKYSWLENYAGSSGYHNAVQTSVLCNSTVSVDQLEMDRMESLLAFCPLLADPANYIPDTVDLNGDQEAREYWLQCFEESLDKFVDKAVTSQPQSATAVERAQQFREKYITRLRHLKQQPFAYGNLTVRSLLDTIEHCLKEFDFPDPYLAQKQLENESALALLSEHLAELDEMEETQRHIELVTSILAGNMFDWGAREVVAMMETKEFGFKQAKNQIPERPWLMDYLDKWLERMKGPVHHCAAIFVDNSGVDIILGILPFARMLIQRGTKVILCANSAPALNDVTYSELLVILRQASIICPVIEKAVALGELISMETAQAGPCLDLSRLNGELAKQMRYVDLLVIEGMGRAVHTNLEATFTCDCLKVAVIKNRWLANRLGGQMFSVLCKFETANVSSDRRDTVQQISTHSKVG